MIYSCRNASIGSTREARIAGHKAASAATASTELTTIDIVIGSYGDTP